MQRKITVRVRCNGHLHRISLTPGGALVLHDHPREVRLADNALVALGGEPPRCLQILEAWRRYDIRALPPGLRPAMEKNIRLRGDRAYNKRNIVDPLALGSRDERLRAFIGPLAARCAYRAGYKRSSTGPHVRVYILSGSEERYIFGCNNTIRISRYGKATNPYLTVRISPRWYVRVFKRGIALVGGCFVVDVLGETSNGDLIVLAGRQGRGFEVRTRRAIISGGKLLWEEQSLA